MPPQGRSSDVLSDRLTRVRKDLAGSAKDIAEKDPALVPGDSREDGLKAQELVEREKASLVCERQVGNFDPKRLEYLRTDRRRLQGELDRCGIFRTLSGLPAVRIPQEILVREERLSDLNEIFDTVRKETFVTKDMKDCSADLGNERRKYAELLLRIDGLKTERADASLRKSLPFEIIRNGYSEEETRRVLQVLGELRSRAVVLNILRQERHSPGIVQPRYIAKKHPRPHFRRHITGDEHFVLDLIRSFPAKVLISPVGRGQPVPEMKTGKLSPPLQRTDEYLENRRKALEKELAISLRSPNLRGRKKLSTANFRRSGRIQELLDIWITTEDRDPQSGSNGTLLSGIKPWKPLPYCLRRGTGFSSKPTAGKGAVPCSAQGNAFWTKNFFRRRSRTARQGADHAAQERGLKERREIALGQKDQFIERDRAIELVCLRPQAHFTLSKTQISLDRELEKSLAAEPKERTPETVGQSAKGFFRRNAPCINILPL